MEESTKKLPTPAFLEKLFDILEDNHSYSNLIAWQPDGNSFIIKRVNEFSETVLPRYFKHSNIQSYIRQLNMYGFSKTRHDSNHHEFTHKLFQRGRRDLLHLIRRKTHQIPPKTSVPNAQTFGIANHGGFDTHMATDDASYADNEPHEFDPSYVIALQSRVNVLENQVDHLSKLCNSLLAQHNSLCEALNNVNSNSKPSRMCSSCGMNSSSVESGKMEVLSGNEDEENGAVSVDSNSLVERSKRKLAEDSDELDDGLANSFKALDAIGSPMKRIRSIDSPNHEKDNEKFQMTYEGKPERGGSISSHTDATTASISSISSRLPPLPGPEMDFLEFKVLSPQLPPFISDIYKIAILRNHRPVSNTGLNLITRSTDSAATTALLTTSSHARNRINLEGLEAIAHAASYLDDSETTAATAIASNSHFQPTDDASLAAFRVKYPMFTPASSSTRHQQEQYQQLEEFIGPSSANASDNDVSLSSATTTTSSSMYAPQQGSLPRPGGPLIKAYSIG